MSEESEADVDITVGLVTALINFLLSGRRVGTPIGSAERRRSLDTCLR